MRDWANAIETELDGVVQKVEFVLDAKQAAALYVGDIA